MKTLVLKDLPRIDELDHAASQAIRGGTACYSREPSYGCFGGGSGYGGGSGCYTQPALISRGGWGFCPPVHSGCAPVYEPCGGKQLSHSGPVEVPL